MVVVELVSEVCRQRSARPPKGDEVILAARWASDRAALGVYGVNVKWIRRLS